MIKLKLVSTVSEELMKGGQVETIEIYEADIAYDRPITKTFIQVISYSAPTKFSRLKGHINYGFSSYNNKPCFNSDRMGLYKTKEQAANAAKIHLLGS